MTETDRIYIAITETMKKHSIEQAIGALKQYITTGNDRYFTSTNNARKMISELSPASVLQDALRTIVKYEYIMEEKGFARNIPNATLVSQAISEYKNGERIHTQLSSEDLSTLIIRVMNNNVKDAVQILAQNPELFESFLGQYSAIVCNCRNELNKISNDNFPHINKYFSQFLNESEKKMV